MQIQLAGTRSAGGVPSLRASATLCFQNMFFKPSSALCDKSSYSFKTERENCMSFYDENSIVPNWFVLV